MKQLTIAKSRFGLIGVFDERANQVRTLTTAHRDDEIISCSSTGMIGQVVFKERTGQSWVRTYDLESGQILGNYRLPDAERTISNAPQDYFRSNNQPVTGSGGATAAGLLAFAVVICFIKVYWLPTLVVIALGTLVYLAITNNNE